MNIYGNILNFIIVLGFNLYFMRNGWSEYKEIYTGELSKWFSLLVWLYALWGIYNMICVIIKLL